MRLRCNCCHRRYGVKLTMYNAHEVYCESCLTLKIQEQLDLMCEAGLMENVDQGLYRLTEKGRTWPKGGRSESDGAASTDVQDTSATESTTQEHTD